MSFNPSFIIKCDVVLDNICYTTVVGDMFTYVSRYGGSAVGMKFCYKCNKIIYQKSMFL